MTSPTNPQPTPPAGYEILSPEVAKMKPQEMLVWYMDKWFADIACGENWHLTNDYCAPLGTTALLLTPGPEAGECDCKPKVHLGHDVDCNCTACEIQRHPHTFRCSAHPRNAYVKVLPGWVDALPNGCPKELLWANKGKSDWTRYNEPGRKIVDTVAAHHQFAYAVPRHVFDALNRPDPEVAKMDESKLRGEQIPRKVCLCGSSRWPDIHMRAMMDETLAGRIVIPMGLYGHADFPPGAKAATCDGDESTEVKQMLDRLHFAKIDASDEILVIRVDDYIGSSTAREIEYAKAHGRPVRFLDTRTPPPVDGSGPTDTEMLDWLEEKYQPGHNFTKLGLWFLQRALGRETEPLRAAIAQAMQSK